MTARTATMKKRNMDWSPGQEAMTDNKYKTTLTRQFDEIVGQPNMKRLLGQYSMAKNTTEKRQHKQDIWKRQQREVKMGQTAWDKTTLRLQQGKKMGKTSQRILLEKKTCPRQHR